MIRIMFVCHGNICRSPMAEFIMKDYVKKMGIEKDYFISSSAISYEEIGNPVYPPVKKILNEIGIDCSNKKSVKLKKEDYQKYDYFIIMDSINERTIKSIFPTDKDNKIRKLLDFTDNPHDVLDPWFTGEFNLAFNEINQGVKGLINYLSEKR